MNPKPLSACFLLIIHTDCKNLKIMNYGAWPKNTMFMPNFIKILLPGRSLILKHAGEHID